MLKLLHTADWHLGRRFPSFDDEAQRKLSRARLEVVSRIFDVARRNSVNAILCAGDLFDDADPLPDFWEALIKILRSQPSEHPPVFLVPGNHDPLTRESVWAPEHAFRRQLPAWAHVVDRDDFSYELAPNAVLVARPCRSRAGENDLALALPAREPGDERLRIGCVHGSTFDCDGYQTNFPIAREAGQARGLDYLAIGDTHSFRDVTPTQPVPTVYPGAPEPTNFGETDAGYVAVVALFRRGTRPRVSRERVGMWQWEDVTCHTLNELRAFMTRSNLEHHVVRLHLDMVVSLSEQSEVDRIVRELQGTAATHARLGVLQLDSENLRVQASSVADFPENLPIVIKDTVERLGRLVDEAPDEPARERVTRALSHLYRLLQAHDHASERRA